MPDYGGPKGFQGKSESGKGSGDSAKEERIRKNIVKVKPLVLKPKPKPDMGEDATTTKPYKSPSLLGRHPPPITSPKKDVNLKEDKENTVKAVFSRFGIDDIDPKYLDNKTLSKTIELGEEIDDTIGWGNLYQLSRWSLLDKSANIEKAWDTYTASLELTETKKDWAANLEKTGEIGKSFSYKLSLDLTEDDENLKASFNKAWDTYEAGVNLTENAEKWAASLNKTGEISDSLRYEAGVNLTENAEKWAANAKLVYEF